MIMGYDDKSNALLVKLCLQKIYFGSRLVGTTCGNSKPPSLAMFLFFSDLDFFGQKLNIKTVKKSKLLDDFYTQK